MLPTLYFTHAAFSILFFLLGSYDTPVSRSVAEKITSLALSLILSLLMICSTVFLPDLSAAEILAVSIFWFAIFLISVVSLIVLIFSQAGDLNNARNV